MTYLILSVDDGVRVWKKQYKKTHLACIRTDAEFRDVRTSVLNDSSNSSAVQAGSDHMQVSGLKTAGHKQERYGLLDFDWFPAVLRQTLRYNWV